MAFQRGKSGNPKGRPKGAANATTKAVRERLAADVDPMGFLGKIMRGEPITRKRGDADEELFPTLGEMLTAARILTPKLVPDARDAPVSFPIGEITGPKDALSIMGRVTAAMANGQLTPSQADAVLSVVTQYAKGFEVHDLALRVAAIEAKTK